MRRIIPAILFFLLLSIGQTHASQDDSFDGKQSIEPIFVIFRLTILDNEAYTQYITKFIKVIKDYDGQTITKDEITRLNAPQESNKKAIIITFENTEQFEKCFTSPEYLDLLTLRSKSVTEKSIVIKGYMRRRDFERFGTTKIIPRIYELSGSVHTIRFPEKEYIIHGKLLSDFKPDLSVVITDPTGKSLFIIFKRGDWVSNELDYGALYVDGFWDPKQFPDESHKPMPQEDKQAPETIPVRRVAKAPSVFMIFEMGKMGEEPSEVYKHRIKIKKIINKYSEVYISGGNGMRPFSGGWRPYNIDLIKFETLDKAKECFTSKEYLENANPEEKTFTETAIILESN
jgi:uncharacterized protein (DUF1330 family)